MTDVHDAAPETLSDTRPMYWSIRRELWENRTIYGAPLVVAIVVLFGCVINTMMLPHRMPRLLAADAAKQRVAIEGPYDTAAGLMCVTAVLVGLFYCLDAPHGERRDRSVLFWKSLPVSDRVTVLSKASIPLVVLPLYALAIAIAIQINILLLSNAVLIGNGPGLAAVWTHVKFVQSWIALTYGIVAITLWHAPVYAWLLLVSGWARRAPLLWAVFPPLAICALEKMAFNSTYFAKFIGYRFVGWFQQAFIVHKGGRVVDPLAAMTPGRFLATPGLWVGLIFAAACLALAIRLRRYRDAI